MAESQRAQVVTVNVVHRLRPGDGRQTAIDKRPVSGAVEVGTLGLGGDTQVDRRHHGGPDKAVYAYAVEDAGWWSEQLQREIPPGHFGENLSTRGLDCTNAVIGERWRIGSDVVVEVRMPRTPCGNLSMRMEIPDFHKQFAASRRVGAYLKVHQPGQISAGDPVVVEERPDHGVTVGDWVLGRTPDQGARLLDSGIDLADIVRRSAQRLARRARSDGETSG